MASKECAICGKPAAPNHRYCTDCDFQARPSGSAAVGAGGVQVAVAPRRGGEFGLFLMVFLFTGLVATVIGLTATRGFSFPALRFGGSEVEPAAATWGELRFAHVATRIRADRSTEAAVIGRLLPGDSVRTDFAEGGWLAVFPANAARRDAKGALGYVYAPLLKQTRPAGDPGAAP